MYFNWSTGAVSPGFSQYIPNVMFADLSVTDARFLPGSFVGYGQVAPAQQSFYWDGLMPGRVHFFRLNGYGSSGWMPSQPVSFATIAC